MSFPHSQIRKTRGDFPGFMDLSVASKTPPKKEVHVMLDNCCIHKNCGQWLKAHPNFKFHFTPVHTYFSKLLEPCRNVFPGFDLGKR
jgi:hypothetical protein